MATNLVTFRAVGIATRAVPGNRRPDQNRRTSGSSNWWSPLFGWSSEPDYIDTESDEKIRDDSKKPETKSDAKPQRTRFAPGCFTEEKARQLRMMTKETESFHDAMYHSAIASRLASDFKEQSDR